MAFPAKRQDIQQFQREMQFVSMGYKNPPTVHGMQIVIPKARLSGNGWAIYPAGAFGDNISSRHFIRQGSVVYPTDQAFPHLGYGWLSIVEIPIGTAEVTASREALSFDDSTRNAVSAARERAYRELVRQVDNLLAGAKTRIEKARVYSEYNGVLDNLRGSTQVSLVRDRPWALGTATSNDPQVRRTDPAESLMYGQHFGKGPNARGVYGRYTQGIEYSILDRIRIVINDPTTKVVRRATRIRNYATADHRLTVFVFDEADPKRRAEGVRWLREILELKDDQFVNAQDLPDNPPERKPRKAPVKRALAPGQYWMLRNEGRVESEIFGESDRGPRRWPIQMVNAARACDFELVWDDTLFVTDKQYEKMSKSGELPDDRRLDRAIEATAKSKVPDTVLDQAQTLVALYRMVGEYNKALPVVMEQFFPGVKINANKAREALTLAETVKIDLRNRPIVAKIESELDALAKQYPLLFQKSDRSHFEHYIKAVKASAVKS